MTPDQTRFRTSVASIRQKRSQGSCSVLVTGGTGFIGSHIAVELLRRGYPVILLARRRGALSAEERVAGLMGWFEVDGRDKSRLTVLEGNLDTEDLGLDAVHYANLVDVVDEVVHCASNTSFSERKRKDVERANVENLQNVLRLAARGHCCFFHHVSTAYVAGRRAGLCVEELVRPREFTNVYEETKYLAEAIVATRCANEGIGLNVYRPSVIYGSSTSGKTLLFNGLYYPVRTVAFLVDLFGKDIDEHGGKRAREMGVRRDGDGTLHMPLRVEATVSGGVNLVPIDHFVTAFMAIMDESLGGGIFHITNTESTTLEELAEFARRFFHVEGISVVPAEAFDALPRNALEVLFDQYVQAYGPYMRDTRTFDNSNTRAIFEGANITCPRFDYGIFSRCMKYAAEVGWGTRLFDRAHLRNEQGPPGNRR
jgi:nucleoside-diphosphate-sugar epimerase